MYPNQKKLKMTYNLELRMKAVKIMHICGEACPKSLYKFDGQEKPDRPDFILPIIFYHNLVS